jgi:hypothetical protein
MQESSQLCLLPLAETTLPAFFSKLRLPNSHQYPRQLLYLLCAKKSVSHSVRPLIKQIYLSRM